jgi:hypothetical protein
MTHSGFHVKHLGNSNVRPAAPPEETNSWGRVVENGTHRELMGQYWELVKLQGLGAGGIVSAWGSIWSVRLCPGVSFLNA